MNNISCKIIEDLLPLYVDGACSEESRNAVESHISACAECRKKLGQMKYSPPNPEIQKNIDDGAMLQKLSDTWKAKTKLNVKTSLFCIIFYIFAIGTLFMAQIGRDAYYRFKTNYMIASIAVNFVFYLLFGVLLTYLARRQRGSVKTNILELIVIGIPAILMASSIFTWIWLPFALPGFIDVVTISKIGFVLLGCELSRLILNSRN